MSATFPLDHQRRPFTTIFMTVAFHLSLWVTAWLALSVIVQTDGFGYLEGDLCAPVTQYAFFAIPLVALAYAEAGKSASWENYIKHWVETLLGRILLTLAIALFAVQFLAPVYGEAARWAALLVLIAMALVSSFVAGRVGTTQGPNVLRGAKVGTNAKDTSDRLDVPPIYWGGDLVRTTDPHFFVIGTTGSGKSLTIQMLLASVVRDFAPNAPLHAFSFDVKGDQGALFKALGVPDRDLHNLDPFSRDGEAWEIASDVTSPEAAEKVAAAMLPSYASKESFWVDAPRRLFSVALETFHVSHPGEWDLLDAIELFGCANSEIMRFLSQSHRGKRAITRFFEADERLLSNVLTTLDTQLGKYEVVARLWRQAEKNYSVQRWVDEHKGVLLLRRNPNEKDSTQEIGRAIFEVAARALMKSSVNTRGELLKDNTWVLLDEFDQLGRLETVSELMRLGRASRVRVIVGTQGMDGMMDTYDSENAARSIVEQCQNMAILRITGKASMEWASSTVGEQDIREANESYTKGQQPSSTVSYSTKTQDAVLGSEFRDVPETGPDTGLVGHYITALGGVWKKTIAWADVLRRLPPIEEEEYRQRESVPAERYAWSKQQKEHFGLLAGAEEEESEGDVPESPPSDGGDSDDEPPSLQTLDGVHE